MTDKFILSLQIWFVLTKRLICSLIYVLAYYISLYYCSDISPLKYHFISYRFSSTIIKIKYKLLIILITLTYQFVNTITCKKYNFFFLFSHIVNVENSSESLISILFCTRSVLGHLLLSTNDIWVILRTSNAFIIFILKLYDAISEQLIWSINVYSVKCKKKIYTSHPFVCIQSRELFFI